MFVLNRRCILRQLGFRAGVIVQVPLLFNFRVDGFEFLTHATQVVAIQSAPDDELSIGYAAVDFHGGERQPIHHRQKVFADVLLGFRVKAHAVLLGGVQHYAVGAIVSHEGLELFKVLEAHDGHVVVHAAIVAYVKSSTTLGIRGLGQEIGAVLLLLAAAQKCRSSQAAQKYERFIHSCVFSGERFNRE